METMEERILRRLPRNVANFKIETLRPVDESAIIDEEVEQEEEKLDS